MCSSVVVAKQVDPRNNTHDVWELCLFNVFHSIIRKHRSESTARTVSVMLCPTWMEEWQSETKIQRTDATLYIRMNWRTHRMNHTQTQIHTICRGVYGGYGVWQPKSHRLATSLMPESFPLCKSYLKKRTRKDVHPLTPAHRIQT